jgi:hypothetical protein
MNFNRILNGLSAFILVIKIKNIIENSDIADFKASSVDSFGNFESSGRDTMKIPPPIKTIDKKVPNSHCVVLLLVIASSSLRESISLIN